MPKIAKVIAETVDAIKDLSPVSTLAQGGKKWSVYRFLQNHPQESWIEVLMKKNYPLEFHTDEEWFKLVEYTRTKKVTK